MRILLTNDDGVDADGIFALKLALEPLGEIFVVAPESQRSAMGHAITLHKPLRLKQVKLRDGSPAWATNGTPADCVVLGADHLMNRKVDLVVSGINHGPNLGWDVHYSGTVSAAMEGAMTGHPAIAVSVASFAEVIYYEAAADFAMRAARWLQEHSLPFRTLLNINVPNIPAKEIAGLSVTTQGPRQYVDRVEARKDPVGRDYFWMGGSLADEHAPEDSDVHAIANNRISITPLQLDMTAHNSLRSLRELEA